MQQQKGQIHIIILVLFVVGFILYANFSGSGFSVLDKLFGNYNNKIKLPAPTVPPVKTVPPQTLIPTHTEPDTAPPQRLNVYPQNGSSLPSETRQITLSIATDEEAICRYSDVVHVAYDLMQGKFSQTNGTLHSVLVTTLSEGGKYTYYIKCADKKGNKNTDDLVISFGVKSPEDKTPPVLSNPSHKGDILPAGTTSAVISISTDESASCSYSGSLSGSFSHYDQTKRFHVKQITGLINGGRYEFFVRCQDLTGNRNTGDVLISFSIGM